MPNLSEVVVETKQSVLRPVILDIVRQLRDITKIPSSTVIVFPDDIGKTYQPGSAISEDPLEKTLFPHNDKIYIEVEEDHDPTSVLSTAVARPEHIPIFNDSNLGIYIKPVYSSTNVSINFKFRAKSKSMAIRWRDDIRMRTSASRDVNLHQISYHYIIPSGFVEILQEIHRLRESQGGYAETFAKYFQNNSTTRLTEISNLSGDVTQPAIAETQMRIVGYFDFEGFPEKLENESDTDDWVGSFTYKFKFDKPIACNMRYPAMIHNQVLSTDFRPAEDSYDIDNHVQSFSLSMNAFNYFESQLQAGKYVNNKATICIPDFDEFISESSISGTVTVFNALCQLSPDNLKDLINLNELDTIAIDPDILEFIKSSEYPFITKAYSSILHLDLYRENYLARDDSITVDSNLNVLSTVDLSIRTNHRIKFSIVYDLSYLSREALNRLKKYPKALVKVFSAIIEGLNNNPSFLELGNKYRLTNADLVSYINNDQLNGRNRGDSRVQFNTVQLSSIIALRADTLK